MRIISVPKYTKGTLITWPEGTQGIAVTENHGDSHIHIKELFSKEADKICFLYLYGYMTYQNEDMIVHAKITRRTAPTVASTEQQAQPGGDDMSTQSEPLVELGQKRKEPETDFGANSLEHKKHKHLWMSTELLHLRSLWWMTQRPKNIILDPHPIWFEEDMRWTRKRKQHALQPEGQDGLLLHLYC